MQVSDYTWDGEESNHFEGVVFLLKNFIVYSLQTGKIYYLYFLLYSSILKLKFFLS